MQIENGTVIIKDMHRIETLANFLWFIKRIGGFDVTLRAVRKVRPNEYLVSYTYRSRR